MPAKQTASKKSSLNTQTELEKLLKSRRIMIILLVIVSLLQTPHTAYVIKKLSFIAQVETGWAHSIALALCIEMFIIIFSIQNRKFLAITYLIYALGINLVMSVFHHSENMTYLIVYFCITAVLPMSTYYISEILGHKSKKKPTTQKKRSYKKRQPMSNVALSQDGNLIENVSTILN